MYGVYLLLLCIGSFLFHALPDGHPLGRLDSLTMDWLISYLIGINVVLFAGLTFAFEFWVTMVVIDIAWIPLEFCVQKPSFVFVVLGWVFVPGLHLVNSIL